MQASTSISSSFFYAAGANAGGADANVHPRSVDNSLYAAEIGIPAAPGHVVGVADRVSETWFLAAKFTSECHYCSTPECRKFQNMPST